MNTPYNTDNENQSSNINIQCEELKFWQIETKLIIISVLGFIITIGCVTVLIINQGKNCSLNNGIFSILGSIIGLCASLFNSQKCRKNSL